MQLRVGIDVGSCCHSVAIGLSDGSLLEEFEVPHTKAGFQDFFKRVEASGRRFAAHIAMAMEGHNGRVRPLDNLVRARG
ncbi:MAG: IS110 family transposase [Geminicoccaceae bacterium]